MKTVYIIPKITSLELSSETVLFDAHSTIGNGIQLVKKGSLDFMETDDDDWIWDDEEFDSIQYEFENEEY